MNEAKPLPAATPRPALRVAPVFDLIDQARGPLFLASHPILTDLREVRTLAAYLRAGEIVSVMPILAADTLDPELAEVVPMDLLTDGTWIWSAATTYYLETYGIAPEPNLLTHLRTERTYSARPDEETLDWIRQWVEAASLGLNQVGAIT